MTISKVHPFREVRYEYRVYGPIWVPVYAYLAFRVTVDDMGEYENIIPLVFAVLFHSGLFFSTKWSTKCRLILDMRVASAIALASHVGDGSGGLFRIERDVWGKMYIEKDFIKLFFNDEVFERPVLPINEKLSQYILSSGLSDADVIGKPVSWMEVPVPRFWNLFQEHVIEPFFVFQIFCVFLWLLDEYWNYALMTLLMLVLLESQVVNRRLTDLKELAKVKPEIVNVSVFRNKKWVSIASNLLFPGDLVALSSSTSIPCDLVLVRNSSALVNEELLTGESVPVLKEALAGEDERKLDVDGADRNSVLFAGSLLLAVKSPQVAGAPKNCIVGYVLRTGFETAQGELVVSILNSEKRVNASSKEAYQFILVLVCVALLAAGWVVYDGIKTGRSRFKLFLSVSHILTSVIPPEFPITMSLTVTLSLAELMRRKIFCTEPFRIPSAGKITDCAFDKTGTLTSSEMVFQGIHNATDVGLAQTVLAACHSLTVVGGRLVGDPIEKAGFASCVVPKKYTVLSRYPFDPILQRMSVVIEGDLLMKGSPESVRSCLGSVPEDYDANCQQLVGQGLRVLALAYKPLEGTAAGLRSAAETNCVFLGFVAFSYTIKPGTVEAISALQAAGLRCIMITGDHLLTAEHVAKVVGITGQSHAFPPEANMDVKSISIWARASPIDKKNIIAALNEEGKVCLFCGDGTNDVSALKEAAVGIAIMGNTSGHASIAAPFVYRENTIRCVPLLVRSGRATLALVMQMYKTLAVNSLITAFAFTVGVKLGDSQTVMESLLMSALSFIMSRPNTSSTVLLDSRRPIVSVFAWSVVCTIFLQAMLHVVLIGFGQTHFGDTSTIDKPFEPSASNTVMFVQLFASHLITCVVNYEGKPSLPSIRQSKLIRNFIVFILFVLALLVSELVPEFNEIVFELVLIGPTPNLPFLVSLHFFGGWSIAQTLRYLERR